MRWLKRAWSDVQWALVNIDPAAYAMLGVALCFFVFALMAG